MLAHVIGFSAVVPMVLAVIAGQWEYQYPTGSRALMIGMALLSGAMLSAATYIQLAS